MNIQFLSSLEKLGHFVFNIVWLGNYVNWTLFCYPKFFVVFPFPPYLVFMKMVGWRDVES